jgi:acyl-CoA synthetase (AMP-forming)/AMP-acid ligase II/thioesterase domain-containing protein/acyl carrier protein
MNQIAMNSIQSELQYIEEMELAIPHLLQTLAQQQPDAIALQGLTGIPLSYQHLWEQVCATVLALNQLGIGRHDRVAVVLPNGPEMAVVFLAIAAGATCAPLNPAYRRQEFDFYLTDLQAKALILPAGCSSPAREVAQVHGIPMLELVTLPEVGAGRFRFRTESGMDLAGNNPFVEPLFSDPQDTALVLHTSGTTARPKIVPLTQANLCRSAHNIRQTLQLSCRDRCLNVMPLFHIHGLVGCLLSSLAAGASVVCTPGFEAERFLTWLQECQPTWYSAVPTMHQAAQAQAQKYGLPDTPLRLIRSSSAAMPSRIMAEMETIFGVPVIEAYGMTEASHQMTSNPLPPGKRKPGSVGIAAGPEIAIMDEVGNCLDTGELGEVVIRGSNVTSGYENNPEANARAFTQGWFRTGDQGYIDADGYLYLKGRLKELINRGGEKIAPQEVDNVLMGLPVIRQAVTFAVPHPTLGEDIASAIVLHPYTQVTEWMIREFLEQNLAPYKLPNQIIFIEEIPKGATGKLQRIGLADKLALNLKPADIKPQNQLEQIIADIFIKLLEVDAVSIHDNFFALGGDSLLAVQLSAELERVFQQPFPLSRIFQNPTIKKISQTLRFSNQTSFSFSLIPIQPDGHRPPLFAIHALIFHSLAKYLGSDQPIYGLRYGLGAQSSQDDSQSISLPERVEDIAAHYIEEMRLLQPEGPYYLMGLCVGGLIAYEMAQQLLAQNQKVALLVLFDVELLQLTPYTKILSDFNDIRRKILNLPKKIAALFKLRSKQGQSCTFHSAYHQADIHHQLPGYNPTRFHPHGDSYLLSSYIPKTFPGKTVFFKPKRTQHPGNPLWTCRLLCTGELDIHEISGYHEEILKEPHVQVLAQCLKSHIDQTL